MTTSKILDILIYLTLSGANGQDFLTLSEANGQDFLTLSQENGQTLFWFERKQKTKQSLLESPNQIQYAHVQTKKIP